jgi:hypothetical protein
MGALGQDLKTTRFWRRFGLHAFAGVGASATVIELFDVLFPNIVPDLSSGLTIAVAAGSISYGAFAAWPRPIKEDYNSPNTSIRVVRGDLFEQDAHLVIGMSNTFDTAVPDIIARTSVQAQFLNRIFHDAVEELDIQLDHALSSVEPIDVFGKSGKTAVYEVGTVATLREHSRRYFCVAYTQMNERNEARGTVDGIWRSLTSLWRAASAHGNGATLAIPVIGGGQARVSQVLPAQDSIRFIVLSFLLASRQEKVCDELRVVVQPDEYDRLDRQELQAFLRSLRPS